MGFKTTLRYLKKKDASAVVVAILVGMSLLNIIQIGANVASQLAGLFFSAVDGTWTSLGSVFNRAFFEQIITNILVALCMLVAIELFLRGWVWYKNKK